MRNVAALFLASITLAGAGAGCERIHYLDTRTDPHRANYGKNVIPVVPPPRVDIVNPDPRGPGGSVIVSNEQPGTWTFTVPPTVTQVERETNDYDRFSLYTGRPAPDDTPFMTITVSRDRTSLAEADPAVYKLANKREFLLNGNIAQEWTGLTANGAGFCELIIRKPGTTGTARESYCHAVAFSRNEDEQKVGLAILTSIIWKAQ